MKALTLQDVMTPFPSTIDEDTDIVTARRIMKEKKIRHLPVLHHGKLRGLLSERDTRVVALLPDLKSIGVAELMAKNPLALVATTKVEEAIRKMIAKKYGCVIVTGSQGDVQGIFTSQDALHLLVTGEKLDKEDAQESDWDDLLG